MKNSFWLFGTHLTIIESEENTDSRYDLIEGRFPPGSETPLHVHSRYSETVYVLEGQVTVYTPGETNVLSTGDTYHIPKNTPHTIANSSKTEPFRALAVASPSGFAKLIRAVGFEGSVNDTPSEKFHDMELALRVLEEIGDTNIGPPGARP